MMSLSGPEIYNNHHHVNITVCNLQGKEVKIQEKLSTLSWLIWVQKEGNMRKKRVCIYKAKWWLVLDFWSIKPFWLIAMLLVS